MRHLWSFIAGIVAAPVVWVLLAAGQHASQQTVDGWGTTDTLTSRDLIGPVIYLAAAGVLLGLLGTLRWSPTGPLAAGALLVLPTAFLFLDPLRTLDGFSYDDPDRVFGQDLRLGLPLANGTLLVLGVLLLMAAFSRGRWQHPPVEHRPAWHPAPVPGPVAQPPLSDEEILAGAEAMEERTLAERSRGHTEGAGTAEARTEEMPAVEEPPGPPEGEPPRGRPPGGTGGRTT